MFGLGFPELILILVIALIIFGPGKLPEVGKAIGKSVREFKKATNEIKKEFEIDDTPITSENSTSSKATQENGEKDTSQSSINTPKKEIPKNPYSTVLDEKEKQEEVS